VIEHSARARRIGRPCIECGRPTLGSRCEQHAAEVELERQARQPYRAAYFSGEYEAARAAAFRRAGGRCEARWPNGSRCRAPAEEAHHLVALSTASSYEEAIALCDEANLLAVCFRHNPRGGRR